MAEQLLYRGALLFMSKSQTGKPKRSLPSTGQSTSPVFPFRSFNGLEKNGVLFPAGFLTVDIARID